MKKLLILFVLLIPILVSAQSGGIRSIQSTTASQTINTLVSTKSRILYVDLGGNIKALSDGTNGQMLKTDGNGNYSWSVGGWNYNNQALSGTTPTWNVQNGLNATITLSGNTSITLTNIESGMTGKISITNLVTAYKIKFTGFTCMIKGVNLVIDSNGITFSGNSAHDSMTWTWDGSILEIHVAKEYTSQTW